MIKYDSCKYLDCGCVVSCETGGGLIVGCDGMECDFREWYDSHAWCVKCNRCVACGKCVCSERFGI